MCVCDRWWVILGGLLDSGDSGWLKVLKFPASCHSALRSLAGTVTGAAGNKPCHICSAWHWGQGQICLGLAEVKYLRGGRRSPEPGQSEYRLNISEAIWDQDRRWALCIWAAVFQQASYVAWHFKNLRSQETSVKALFWNIMRLMCSANMSVQWDCCHGIKYEPNGKSKSLHGTHLLNASKSLCHLFKIIRLHCLLFQILSHICHLLTKNVKLWLKSYKHLPWKPLTLQLLFSDVQLCFIVNEKRLMTDQHQGMESKDKTYHGCNFISNDSCRNKHCTQEVK